jgi:hypothetical protein
MARGKPLAPSFTSVVRIRTTVVRIFEFVQQKNHRMVRHKMPAVVPIVRKKQGGIPLEVKSTGIQSRTKALEG